MNKLSIIVKGFMISMSLIGITHADSAHDSTQSSLLNSWAKFYAGLNAGFSFNEVQLRSQHLGFTHPSTDCNSSSNFSTFFPGIQLGYMYQFLNASVLGIEANLSLNTKEKDTLSCNCPLNPNVSDRFSFKIPMQGSIKGRGGLTLNWNKNILLPYLTAGVSFADLGLTYKNEGGDYYSKNTTQAGWLLGAGIEWAFRKNWSLRAEYSYVDYGNTIKLNIPTVYGLIDPNGHAHVKLSANNFLVAINYWIY